MTYIKKISISTQLISTLDIFFDVANLNGQNWCLPTHRKGAKHHNNSKHQICKCHNFQKFQKTQNCRICAKTVNVCAKVYALYDLACALSHTMYVLSNWTNSLWKKSYVPCHTMYALWNMTYTLKHQKIKKCKKPIRTCKKLENLAKKFTMKVRKMNLLVGHTRVVVGIIEHAWNNVCGRGTPFLLSSPSSNLQMTSSQMRWKWAPWWFI